jgi:hypothetical protein
MARPFAALGELKPCPPNGLWKKWVGRGAGRGGVGDGGFGTDLCC